MFSSREIHSRVQTGYIERLGVRLKRMRKQLVDRDWMNLRAEASHVAEGAQNFGYADLAIEVQKAIHVLNAKPLSRVSVDTDAKNAMENLFKTLDRFLFDTSHS